MQYSNSNINVSGPDALILAGSTPEAEFDKSLVRREVLTYYKRVVSFALTNSVHADSNNIASDDEISHHL